MPNFSQQSVDITTLHILNQDTQHLYSRLLKKQNEHKAIVVIPCLATEFTEEENRSVFTNILLHLCTIEYLHTIIFGLDGADESDMRQLESLIRGCGLRNAIIQWNEGAEFSALYQKLEDAGFDVSIPGKGRNMFMSFGVCLALDADSVAVIDADIKSFSKEQIDRLLYPVMALDYDFAKGYYSRIHNNHFYGRVKRLLVDPLLIALKRQLMHGSEEKFVRILDFLLNFHYQLSGEVAYRRDLLKQMRFSMNWGVEIYSLIEVYRKASSICQVQFSSDPFDHKHQNVDNNHGKPCGLQEMAVDIIGTLLNFLMVEEGLVLGPTFFRDLSETYITVAKRMIKKYAHDSTFNNLQYDRDAEERLVRDVFRTALVTNGERLSFQSRLSAIFLFFTKAHPEFMNDNAQGLAEVIMEVAENSPYSLLHIPHTPSWESVIATLPHILDELSMAASPVSCN
ncbi:glycosyltransferase family protein [Desulfogranum japonicum]|uniref:hypothetical protein n=1 Tax=Desulfogranum japonicum TaxID=231447 RepID=UPI0004102A72|nr:hypothetical protein [Desulfogranum japonicum]